MLIALRLLLHLVSVEGYFAKKMFIIALFLYAKLFSFQKYCVKLVIIYLFCLTYDATIFKLRFGIQVKLLWALIDHVNLN